MEQLSLPFNLTSKEMQILTLLHGGRSQVVRSTDISRHTGIDRRQVREVIKHLREHHGCAIGSSSGRPAGYYLINDPKELEEFRRAMRRRGISILYMVARVSDSSLEAVFNQGRLELEGEK